MSTTRSSRSTATRSRAPGSATPGCAGSTPCWPPSPSPDTAPVIVAQRLRKGSCGSPRGAARLIGDAVKQARRLLGPDRPVLVRMDSAFFGGPAVRAALAGGADVSVTVRLTATIKTAIAGIEDGAWTTIEYTDAIRDESHRGVDLPGRGRRDPLHRVRRAEDGAPGPGPARRAPHPRPQRRPEQGRRARHPVRRVALPRVLHHHRPRRPRHRRRRPDPPRTTRSSSRSTPTSRAPPWRTCPPGSSPRTPPGSCSPSSRSTSPAPPPPSTEGDTATPPRPEAGQGEHRDHPPHADRTSPPGSRPPRAASPCTCPGTGPGKTPGPSCSGRPAARHRRPHGPDHPAGDGTSKDPPWNTPTARPGDHPRPHPSLSPRARSARLGPAHRWIEAKSRRRSARFQIEPIVVRDTGVYAAWAETAQPACFATVRPRWSAPMPHLQCALTPRSGRAVAAESGRTPTF